MCENAMRGVHGYNILFFYFVTKDSKKISHNLSNTPVTLDLLWQWVLVDNTYGISQAIFHGNKKIPSIFSFSQIGVSKKLKLLNQPFTFQLKSIN